MLLLEVLILFTVRRKAEIHDGLATYRELVAIYRERAGAVVVEKVTSYAELVAESSVHERTSLGT